MFRRSVSLLFLVIFPWTQRNQCLYLILVDHVFCVTGDQRKVPAGTFFHDVNASGHNLTCVCPVHLKGGGEGKTRVACTKDDVIEGSVDNKRPKHLVKADLLVKLGNEVYSRI